MTCPTQSAGLEQPAVCCKASSDGFGHHTVSIKLRGPSMATTQTPSNAGGTSSQQDILVKVRTMQPATHELRLPRTSTLQALAQQLEPLVNTPPTRQRLIFRGRVCEHEQTLDSIGFQDGDTMHLVIRPEDAPPPQPSSNARAGGRSGSGRAGGGQGGGGAITDLNQFLQGVMSSFMPPMPGSQPGSQGQTGQATMSPFPSMWGPAPSGSRGAAGGDNAAAAGQEGGAVQAMTWMVPHLLTSLHAYIQRLQSPSFHPGPVPLSSLMPTPDAPSDEHLTTVTEAVQNILEGVYLPHSLSTMLTQSRTDPIGRVQQPATPAPAGAAGAAGGSSTTAASAASASAGSGSAPAAGTGAAGSTATGSTPAPPGTTAATAPAAANAGTAGTSSGATSTGASRAGASQSASRGAARRRAAAYRYTPLAVAALAELVRRADLHIATSLQPLLREQAQSLVASAAAVDRNSTSLQASIRSLGSQIHASAALLAELSRLAASVALAVGGNLLPLTHNSAAAIQPDGSAPAFPRLIPRTTMSHGSMPMEDEAFPMPYPPGQEDWMSAYNYNPMYGPMLGMPPGFSVGATTMPAGGMLSMPIGMPMGAGMPSTGTRSSGRRGSEAAPASGATRSGRASTAAAGGSTAAGATASAGAGAAAGDQSGASGTGRSRSGTRAAGASTQLPPMMTTLPGGGVSISLGEISNLNQLGPMMQQMFSGMGMGAGTGTASRAAGAGTGAAGTRAAGGTAQPGAAAAAAGTAAEESEDEDHDDEYDDEYEDDDYDEDEDDEDEDEDADPAQAPGGSSAARRRRGREEGSGVAQMIQLMQPLVGQIANTAAGAVSSRLQRVMAEPSRAADIPGIAGQVASQVVRDLLGSTMAMMANNQDALEAGLSNIPSNASVEDMLRQVGGVVQQVVGPNAALSNILANLASTTSSTRAAANNTSSAAASRNTTRRAPTTTGTTTAAPAATGDSSVATEQAAPATATAQPVQTQGQTASTTNTTTPATGPASTPAADAGNASTTSRDLTSNGDVTTTQPTAAATDSANPTSAVAAAAAAAAAAAGSSSSAAAARPAAAAGGPRGLGLGLKPPKKRDTVADAEAAGRAAIEAMIAAANVKPSSNTSTDAPDAAAAGSKSTQEGPAATSSTATARGTGTAPTAGAATQRSTQSPGLGSLMSMMGQAVNSSGRGAGGASGGAGLGGLLQMATQIASDPNMSPVIEQAMSSLMGGGAGGGGGRGGGMGGLLGGLLGGLAGPAGASRGTSATPPISEDVIDQSIPESDVAQRWRDTLAADAARQQEAAQQDVASLGPTYAVMRGPPPGSTGSISSLFPGMG